MVSAVQITHIFNGDNSASDFVDAAELDTQFSNIANTLNQEIATRQISISDQGRINNSIVRYTSLHPEVIAALQGIIPGQDVQAVSQTNIAALTGTPIIDGYQTVIGDRVLLVGQTAQVQNGIYVVAAGAWAIAYDSAVTFTQYQCWAVLNGTSGAGTTWMVYTLGTTGSVASTFIPILGFSSLLPITRGGTGANNAPQALINLGVQSPSTAMLPVFQASTLTGAAALFGVVQQVTTVAALRLVTQPTAAGILIATAGYYAAGDGGKGVYQWNATDTTADNGGTIIQITGVTTGRWHLMYDDGTINVRQFGAKGDGVTNDAAALQAACAWVVAQAYGTVLIPAGNFLTNGSLNVGGNAIVIAGLAQNASVITNTTAAVPTITVTSGSNNITVRDLTLTRNVTATAGGDGIQFGITGGAGGYVFRINSTYNYYGFNLGGAQYSLIQDCFASYNQSDGFRYANNNTVTALLWYSSNLFSQQNGGAGFRVFSGATTSVCSTGSFVGCRSYANTLNGFIATGSASCPVESVRIEEGFFGQDNGSAEIYLDTYGTDHYIDTCFIELGGSAASGPTLATPATYSTYGIFLTANNNDVQIIGGIINGNTNSGIYSSTPLLKVVGVRLSYNGTSAAVPGIGTQCGVNAIAGVVELIGCSSKFNLSYGIYCNVDNGHKIVGCDMSGNTTGGIGPAMTTCIIQGCTPLLGTGWTVMTGTPSRSTYATSTVTLAQLAGVVMALQQDLISQRIIGT